MNISRRTIRLCLQKDFKKQLVNRFNQSTKSSSNNIQDISSKYKQIHKQEMDSIPGDCDPIDNNAIKNPTMKDVILGNNNKDDAAYSQLGMNSSTSSQVSVLYSTLHDLCLDNVAYYSSDVSTTGRRLHAGFTVLVEQIGVAAPMVDQLLSRASEFDFDETTPANGYRSYVTVVNACVSKAVQVCRNVKENRNSIFFRKNVYAGKVDRYGDLLTSLTICLHQLIVMLTTSQKEDLFADESLSVDFLKLADSLNTLPFYGLSVGFQFCESMRIILRNISIGLASYSEVYEVERCAFTKGAIGAWSGFRYTYNPELRAEKLVAISKFASLEFCKSFWFLSESAAMYKMSNRIGPGIPVNKVLLLDPLPLTCMATDKKEIEIPVASSHFAPAPIPAHLFSATKRKGMCADATGPPSPNLIIHCHGGGFVAQSPRSHEIYLRDWARQLDVPILSIDYSLAPKAPFPRPLEEVLYAYCWALKNCSQLGSTAERVVFVGDSAGANLCMSLALKCIDLKLPLPVGIFVAYFPVLVSSAPSPSRILTFMDPILPYGFLLGCLRAYACPAVENFEKSTDIGKQPLILPNKVEPVTNGAYNDAAQNNKNTTDDTSKNDNYNNNIKMVVTSPKTFVVQRDLNLEVPHDPFLSPWWASDEVLRCLPPVSILTLELDPCLDDGVMFARRLKRLGNVVTLDVEKGLPHGFLYFAMLCPEARAASDLCVKRIAQLFGDDQMNIVKGKKK